MTRREKLRCLRNDLGYSQVAFSEILGVQSNTYSGYESGRYTLPDYIIDKLHELYGIDTAAFSDEGCDTYLPPGGIPAGLQPQKKRQKKKSRSKSITITIGWPRMPERCDVCMFSLKPGSYAIGCEYMAHTGKPRGCPVGDQCTRYIRSIRRTKRNEEEGHNELMD